MAHLGTIATYFAVVLFLSSTVADTTSSSTDVTFDVREPAQLKMAEWAVERFEEAGLDLPRLLVRFPGPESPLCDGIQGRSFLSRDPIEVRICWVDDFILLHELAHVWEAQNFAEEKRTNFMDMRTGVLSWASNDVVWGARGREHAANAIAWGLLEEPYLISTTYPNDRVSMMEAFSFLTGTEPLHDGGGDIKLPDQSRFGGTEKTPLESGR